MSRGGTLFFVRRAALEGFSARGVVELLLVLMLVLVLVLLMMAEREVGMVIVVLVTANRHAIFIVVVVVVTTCLVTCRMSLGGFSAETEQRRRNARATWAFVAECGRKTTAV